jgi:hypothetical protein
MQRMHIKKEDRLKNKNNIQTQRKNIIYIIFNSNVKNTFTLYVFI